MKCPHCQAENREGAEFCGKCGKPLLSELICANCSHPNPTDNLFCDKCGQSLTDPAPTPTPTKESTTTEPTSFVDDRYQVIRKLGEGGKKKVYLVHDTKLDRDVAFALIKTENLDENGRKRVTREAQAMGKLDNPSIVSIFDYGEINDQPYIVIPVMGGGDVEELIEKAPDHKLPLEQVISIAKSVCQGLDFAHSKGVIHRDIKPGNIWLNEEGAAKIGDFGLAMNINVSRMTQENIMVGTYLYMSPEQAIPGEVTYKADLYSLGAMLYEMVTGRPPFVGEDSYAIIGGHLNTQPILPTWHRADLPPTFESLIMLLLEKDPEKRPSSAKDVLAALESIEKGDIKESTIEQQVPTENPLYRRVFVGRENELKILQNAFTGAISGQGALTMVVGEPGIGKTAICDQLSTFVTLRGGKTLTGNCYEEGSLSIPYLAFVEAMRSYVLDREPDDLKKELGSGATDVARIVSEIREKLKIEPREAENPEEDRYRLMQAVTSFLSNAAAVKPMLVILEDLHDADKGTLEMLGHVSRNLTNTRLMMVGTYRDIEVDRNHPLSAALAELRRVSSFGRVLLRGLSIDEVRRMLESLIREDIPLGLADAVHRQTEGNPLFVQEVVRYLTEEKLLIRESGKMIATGETPLEMSIPEGLRDVIGKRLTNLSEECNHLLSVASVIGREFALDTLKTVADISDDVFVNALKEAIQLSILEERSQVGVIRYRFTHAFFRQTLYEELIAPQRLQLHQQVARSMEEVYSKRLEEHASELAEHFSQSTDQADLKKAVEYSEMAAKRAVDVYAYGEAIRLLDQAIKVQRVLDPDDKETICDLLLELCDALLFTPDSSRVLEKEVPLAFSLAESIGDSSRAVRACLDAIYAITLETPSMILVGTSPQFNEWANRADHYAAGDTVERAYADWSLGIIKCSSGDIHTGLNLFNQSMDLSRRLGAQEIYYRAAYYLLVFTRAPHHTEERRKLAEEIWANIHGKLPIRSQGIGYWVGNIFFALGDRNRAEEAWREEKVFAETSQIFYLEIGYRYQDAVLSYIDGRFEDALDIVADMRTRSEAIGLAELTNMFAGTAEYRPRICMGRSVEGLEDDIRGNPGRMPEFSNILSYLGKNEEASEILEREVIKRPGIGTTEDETTASNDIMFLEAAVLTGNKKSAQLLLDRFTDSGLFFTVFFHTCIPRHLGGAAVLLKRYDEAREHYNEAIKVCTEMRFRPELALSRLEFAELLLDHYPDEKAEALEHLDFAIKEFREMKMQPSLERALRRKDILKA
ncbi:protein kinase [Chloroflexota bacterium]